MQTADLDANRQGRSDKAVASHQFITRPSPAEDQPLHS
jgi:hypothetical protein